MSIVGVENHEGFLPQYFYVQKQKHIKISEKYVIRA